MGGVFVLGLPKQLRARLDTAMRRQGENVTNALADSGKEGTMYLVPNPDAAVHKLRDYYRSSGEQYEDAYILVIPYITVPPELEQELAILEDLGGEVVRPVAGQNNWPQLKKRQKPDDRFFNDLFCCIIEELICDDDEPPSNYFRSIAERQPRFIIARGALDNCDEVAEIRREFLRDAADAFLKFVDENGRVGRIDGFFRSLGLEHAQSGGITTTLTVIKGGQKVHFEKANAHLKQGDGTTLQGAARIYYQHFSADELCYIVLFYAGPHPVRDISVQCELV